MTEANPLLYNHDAYPFYDVLDELTDWTYANGATPLETYLHYRRLRRNAHLTPCPDYASTSLTSGGHARRPDLETYEKVSANTETARRTIVEMSSRGTLDARGILLPADLGYIPHWQQSDYMHLWSLVIGGPDLGMRRANHLASRYKSRIVKNLGKSGVDLHKMDDPMLPANERASEYFRFAETFAKTIDRDIQNATPVRSVIGLIDPESSLGCQTEKLLARLLGLPVRRISPAHFIDSYTGAISDRKLEKDFDTIVRFGGMVVEAAKGSILALKTIEA